MSLKDMVPSFLRQSLASFHRLQVVLPLLMLSGFLLNTPNIVSIPFILGITYTGTRNVLVSPENNMFCNLRPKSMSFVTSPTPNLPRQ